MGMTVEEAETDMETTVAEVAATIVMEAEVAAEEVAAATWRTGRSRPPGTRGLRWNSSALGRVAVAGWAKWDGALPDLVGFQISTF